MCFWFMVIVWAMGLAHFFLGHLCNCGYLQLTSSSYEHSVSLLRSHFRDFTYRRCLVLEILHSQVRHEETLKKRCELKCNTVKVQTSKTTITGHYAASS